MRSIRYICEARGSGNPRLNIEEYNGGLFAKDKYLDSLIVDDKILEEQPLILSSYKFGRDISGGYTRAYI